MRLLVLVCTTLLLIACTKGNESPSNEIVISCGAVGVELDLCRTGAENWAKETGHRVRVVTAASNSSDRLANYQLLLAAHSPDIDVFVIDTPWPGIIGDFFLDLNGRVPKERLSDYFPEYLANNTVKGRLVALPWFIDGGLLYYRKDLLAKYGRRVPQTWQELTDTAETIQKGERKGGRANFWGFVFAARAYEGLTCVALEWIHSVGGGAIVDPRGQVTIDNAQAAKMLELASSWIGRISPPGVLNYMEEETRAVFQSGDAVFMRNWPYAWTLAEAPDSPVKGKVGLSVLPKGTGPGSVTTSALGGWSLAISRFSRKPELSLQLVQYLSRPEEQKRRSIEGGLSPTLRSVYDDADLLKANPSLEQLFPVFSSALPRPSSVVGSDYNRVSSEFYEAVHASLATGQAKKNLTELKDTLELVRRKGRWP